QRRPGQWRVPLRRRRRSRRPDHRLRLVLPGAVPRPLRRPADCAVRPRSIVPCGGRAVSRWPSAGRPAEVTAVMTMSASRGSLSLLAGLIAAGLLQGCRRTSAVQPRPAPPQVNVVTVQPERVTLTSEWVATLDGYVNAQIRPQVSGYLIKRDYDEGAVVRKGQALFEIDARPFEAALSQARAQLAEMQAQLGKTERDVQRDQPMAEQHAIAQSQLDNDVQANLAAQAAVKSAQAAVETAQLNLGFTKVVSLVDGVAAIATAQIGDLVGPATLL